MARHHRTLIASCAAFAGILFSASIALSPGVSLAQDAEDQQQKIERALLEDKIDRNIGQLRSSSQALRDDATDELSELGEDALPILEARRDTAKEDGETEVESRLNEAIDAIREREGLADEDETQERQRDVLPRDEHDRGAPTPRRSGDEDYDRDVEDDYDSDVPSTPQPREDRRTPRSSPWDDGGNDQAPGMDTERLAELLEKLQELQQPQPRDNDDQGEEESDLPNPGDGLDALEDLLPDTEEGRRAKHMLKLLEALRGAMEDMRDGDGEGFELPLPEPQRDNQPEERDESADDDEDYGSKQLESGEDEY